MSEMTNPMNALISLQEAVTLRYPLHFQQGSIHSDLLLHADRANNKPRLCYAIINNVIVKALSIFCQADPLNDIPCFGVGYAVANAFRGQGFGAEILKKGIDELKHGMARNGMKTFYVEAVVATTNIVSIKIASKILISESEENIDSVSGMDAIAFRLLIV